LHANYDKAFLDLTADVPEVCLHFGPEGTATKRIAQPQIHLRWYKLASSLDTAMWVDKLLARGRAPLVVLGGDTSDRAVTLASILRERQSHWGGAPPLLVITTASADRYYPGEDQTGSLTETYPKLMDLYKGRTFRFGFTNTRMADAVLDFLHQHPEVWLPVNSEPGYLAGVVAGAAGTSWSVLANLSAGGYFRTHALYTVAWLDDRYSQDLSDRFAKVFLDKFAASLAIPFASDWERTRDDILVAMAATPLVERDVIPYGVGDYSLPNPPEARAAGQFLANTTRFRRQRQMLALPTGSQHARRFLRTLCGMAPVDTRNLVVISGDSINFNNIYRDRDLAWNVLDMPVPLVFFSHRNPVSERAGFGRRVSDQARVAATGTQDLLLYADIVQALAAAAFQNGALVGDPDVLRDHLARTKWYRGQVESPAFCPVPAESVNLFNTEGDRNRHTGEHIVWLRPEFTGDLVQMQATITVWRVPAADPLSQWHPAAAPLHVSYNTISSQGLAGNGAD
jgi:hypothetical protein